MRKAFTMIEFVFVIVVMGILAATIIPSTRTNPVQEASVQLLSDIRYTQHLGMVDDKYGDNRGVNWYEKRWQIIFDGNKYSISTIDSTGAQQFAKKPTNSSLTFSDIDLNAKYGVTVSLKDGCVGESIISFDFLGRPMVGTLATGAALTDGQLVVSDAGCNIELTNGTETTEINIARETGYARINFNP